MARGSRGAHLAPRPRGGARGEPRRGAAALAAAHHPAARPLLRRRGRGRRRARRLELPARSGRAGASRRPASRAGCASRSSGSAPPTSSSADRLVGARPLPAGARRGVQALPRPGPARAVRGGAPRASRRSWAGRSTRSSRTFDERPLAAASIAQVHAATLAPAKSVVVKVQRPRVAASSCAATSQAMAWIAPLPRRPHPGGGARQPAGAGRAVRRDHRRGARLPARGARTCSTSRACSCEAGQTTIVVPRPHPHAGDAPRARDGAPLGLQVRATSRACAQAGIDTDGGRARAAASRSSRAR